MRTNAFISLLVVAVLYQLANIAYFAAGGSPALSDILGVNPDLDDSFEDGARAIDTDSRQLILPEGLRLEWCCQRP